MNGARLLKRAIPLPALMGNKQATKACLPLGKNPEKSYIMPSAYKSSNLLIFCQIYTMFPIDNLSKCSAFTNFS